MKLLYCNTCHTVFSLGHDTRTCPSCGECSGRYTDKWNAEWWGEATPLGFANSSFVAALGDQPDSPGGRVFEAFVVERRCPTFKRVY